MSLFQTTLPVIKIKMSHGLFLVHTHKVLLTEIGGPANMFNILNCCKSLEPASFTCWQFSFSCVCWDANVFLTAADKKETWVCRYCGWHISLLYLHPTMLSLLAWYLVPGSRWHSEIVAVRLDLNQQFIGCLCVYTSQIKLLSSLPAVCFYSPRFSPLWI